MFSARDMESTPPFLSAEGLRGQSFCMNYRSNQVRCQLLFENRVLGPEKPGHTVVPLATLSRHLKGVAVSLLHDVLSRIPVHSIQRLPE